MTTAIRIPLPTGPARVRVHPWQPRRIAAKVGEIQAGATEIFLLLLGLPQKFHYIFNLEGKC